MTLSASVVIAAYEAAAFVQAAIASALAQTRKDIEVIVVDDGSTDGTWELLQACAQRDPRVVPLRQPRRMGPSAARNAAIAQARGQWIAVLDADDLFLPDRLERMIAHAEVAGADLLADDLLRQDFATGESLGYCFGRDALLTHPGPLPLIELVRHDMPDKPGYNKLGFLQPIIRRDLLLKHRIRYAEDVRAGEDFLLYFECVAHGGQFHLLPEALYVYRLRSGSVSTSMAAPFQQGQANCRMLRMAKALGDAELMALLRRRQRLLDFTSFTLAAEQGWIGTALRYAQYGEPELLLRQARIAAGIVRQRLVAWAAARKNQPSENSARNTAV
jgi:glycosyltransferase involved in cell wall biosynthesis